MTFGIVTIGLLVVGFQQLGSPMDMAKYRRDRMRVADILAVASQINQTDRNYYVPKRKTKAVVPKAVDSDLMTEFPRDNWTDPQTDKPYKYRRIDGHSYEICATFELSSVEFDRRGQKLPDARWNHEPGELCIRFKATEDIDNPYLYGDRGY